MNWTPAIGVFILYRAFCEGYAVTFSNAASRYSVSWAISHTGKTCVWDKRYTRTSSINLAIDTIEQVQRKEKQMSNIRIRQ